MSLDKITLEIITNPIDWNEVLQEIVNIAQESTVHAHKIVATQASVNRIIVFYYTMKVMMY